MTDNFTYWAFISYSHADDRWGRWLHRAIESYRIPAKIFQHANTSGMAPKRLFPVFRDRDELASSPELGDRIRDALDRSQNLVVICSPAAARSEWVNEEIRYFRSIGRGDQIFCLIVDGEPGDVNRECIPPAIRAPRETGANPIEPIAADARAHADGRRNALLKLIAGILNVGFDALKQRDLARRNLRLSVFAAASLAVALAMGALSAYAVRQSDKAQQRQAQTEELIQFMLDDLSDQLAPIGKLSLLRGVTDKAIGYFDTLEDDAITWQARMYRIEAEAIRLGLRDQENSELAESRVAALLTLVRQARDLAAERPDSIEIRELLIDRLIDASDAVFWESAGDQDQAASLAREAIAEVENLQTMGTRAGDQRLNEMLAHVVLANSSSGVAGATGQDNWNHPIRIGEALVADEPNNRRAQFELLWARGSRANGLLRVNRNAEAERDIRANIATARRMLADDPANAEARDQLSYNYVILHVLGRKMRSLETMRTASEDAVALGTRLVSVDTENLAYQLSLERALWSRSEMRFLSGDIDGAVSDSQKIFELFDRLPADTLNDIGFWHDYVNQRLSCAEYLLADLRVREARACVSDALVRVKRGENKSATDSVVVRDRIWAAMLALELSKLTGDPQPQWALTIAQEALATSDGMPALFAIRFHAIQDDSEALARVLREYRVGDYALEGRFAMTACKRAWIADAEFCANLPPWPIQ